MIKPCLTVKNWQKSQNCAMCCKILKYTYKKHFTLAAHNQNFRSETGYFLSLLLRGSENNQKQPIENYFKEMHRRWVRCRLTPTDWNMLESVRRQLFPNLRQSAWELFCPRIRKKFNAITEKSPTFPNHREDIVLECQRHRRLKNNRNPLTKTKARTSGMVCTSHQPTILIR